MAADPTLIDWPVDLPQVPLKDGFQVQEEDTRISFKPQSGQPKMRNDPVEPSSLFRCSFRVSNDQLRLLRRFYRRDLGRGTMPFNYTDPLDYDVARFSFETPPAAIQNEGERDWIASFTLRRLP